jgi:dihydroxyacetone kinase-like predicted kinase
VLDRLLVSGGELVTVVTGRDAAGDLAEQLESYVVADRPELDVLVHRGDQEGYPLFLAVE